MKQAEERQSNTDMNNMTQFSYIMIYLIVVNCVTFFVYAADKKKAEKGKWRIPEAVLFGLAVIGGSLGAYAGMKVFHHKTRKYAFVGFIPILLVAQVAIVIYIVR